LRPLAETRSLRQKRTSLVAMATSTKATAPHSLCQTKTPQLRADSPCMSLGVISLSCHCSALIRSSRLNQTLNQTDGDPASEVTSGAKSACERLACARCSTDHCATVPLLPCAVADFRSNPLIRPFWSQSNPAALVGQQATVAASVRHPQTRQCAPQQRLCTRSTRTVSYTAHSTSGSRRMSAMFANIT
jgi:hypothetical protein